MADKLLVRRVDAAHGRYQWLKLGGPAQNTESGDLASLAAAATDCEVILLLPKTMVLLLEASLPIKNPAQIRQALPFALEDKLADDIENYHLAWVRQVNQKLAVAAVAKSAFTDCLERLRQVGVDLVAAYPESLCLPWRPDECTLLIEGDQATFRYGAWQGGGIEAHALSLLLAQWRDEGLKFSQMSVWGSGRLADCEAMQGVAYVEETSEEALALFARQLDDIAALNLLTGSYLIRATAEESIRRWWPAAAIFAVALALQWFSQLQLNWQLQKEVETMDAQMQSLFRRTFPDVKRIVNVRIQADQGLQSLKKQRQTGGSGFMPLLYATGEQLTARPELKLRSLSFAEDSLRLGLAGDAAASEQFVQSLQGAWAVNMQTLDNPAQGVEVQVGIKPR